MPDLSAVLFVIISSAPPNSPAEAVRILRASRSVADRTDVPVFEEPLRRHVSGSTSSMTGGPFGELKSTPIRPSCCNTYVHEKTPELIVHVKWESR